MIRAHSIPDQFLFLEIKKPRIALGVRVTMLVFYLFPIYRSLANSTLLRICVAFSDSFWSRALAFDVVLEFVGGRLRDRDCDGVNR